MTRCCRISVANCGNADQRSDLLENCIARGSLTMRCHVDIDPEFGLRHVEAMQQLRERYRDLIDLELVVFPQTGLISRPGTAELMLKHFIRQVHEGRTLVSPRIAAVKDAARRRLRGMYETAEKQLEGRDWLAGFRSFADPYFYITLRWADRTGVDLSGLPNIAAFKQRMEADAGVQAALKAEGLA